MEELLYNILNVITVAICMYRSSTLVPLDSCLTAAACLSSA